MPDAPTCKTCGAPLSDAGVAGGLCGRCLVRFAIDAGDETRAASAALPPDRIGPYRLVEKIAEGGMGVVFRAEQQSPVRRTVAIKLIRPGLDSAQVLARFDAERQAMALMDHPGIARIHDAGATEDGRPYFVMEHVPGEPVTTHCDRRKLGTKDRIGLFLAICDAVQHAHHKGVVHRDLKPSNVLVAEKDGKPAIKVIDFGIAKATQQKLTDRTLVTRIGLAVGTPEYMSPEQASGNGLDVDTRTDVYSLGVLLYELLVGALPFDPEALRRAAIEEVLKTIREVDPPRPSERLHTLGDASTTSASLRSTEPRTLEREIRGDLDWIAMKALEKDRNRRYGSPAELAADLRRHLAFEPVLAGPPSAAYRARKFVRRHRVGVAITSAAAAALVVGIVGTSYGLIRATRAEKLARENATTAERVSDFLVGLFEVNDPSEARGKTITAREVLDKGVQKIEAELESEPAVRAKLESTMGKVYTNLGLLPQAEALLRQAMAQGVARSGHPDGEVVVQLAWLLTLRGKRQEAVDLISSGMEELVSAGDERLLARALTILGNAQRILGDHAEAERNLVRAVEIGSRVDGADGRAALVASVNLASLFLARGMPGSAFPVIDRSVRGLERLSGPDAPMTLTARRTRGHALIALGRGDEAVAELESVLAVQRRIFGDGYNRLCETYDALGDAYALGGRLEDALLAYRGCIGRRDVTLGPGHGQTVDLRNKIARTFETLGRVDEAEREVRDALARIGTAEAPHPAHIESRLILSRLLRARGEAAEARKWIDEAVELSRGLDTEWGRRAATEAQQAAAQSGGTVH